MYCPICTFARSTHLISIVNNQIFCLFHTSGQCLMCDGQEVIMTSWMLRVRVDTCTDKWKSVHIGRDYFTRHEQTMGPRRRFGTHTPSGYDNTVTLFQY